MPPIVWEESYVIHIGGNRPWGWNVENIVKQIFFMLAMNIWFGLLTSRNYKDRFRILFCRISQDMPLDVQYNGQWNKQYWIALDNSWLIIVQLGTNIIKYVWTPSKQTVHIWNQFQMKHFQLYVIKWQKCVHFSYLLHF